MECIKKLRQKNPLILNITNIVVSNYVANGLLSIGASPLMSNAIEEMEELGSICDALLINIGTLNPSQVEAMIKAGKSANRCGIPVVFDPVGIAASSFRKEMSKKLLMEVKFTAIRGNAGEIAYLADKKWNAKGVDAGSGSEDLKQIAKKVAQKYSCVVALSGEIDYISDGEKIATIKNGTPLFTKITGSGCLLGSIMAAFLTLSKDSFKLCVNANIAFTIAGELASKDLKAYQNGQFYIKLLESLSLVDDEKIKKYERVSYE